MTHPTMPAPQMVFMMGLPAAGKSTVAARLFAGWTHLDPDAIKETLPGYDPAHAYRVHDLSMDIFAQQFDAAVAARTGHIVVDGTGVNAEAMVRRMVTAQGAGFHTTLCYVTCTLRTSLARAAARPRQVPESVIREKAANIATSFDIVSRYADAVQVVAND